MVKLLVLSAHSKIALGSDFVVVAICTARLRGYTADAVTISWTASF